MEITEHLNGLIGIHFFKAYEGDIEKNDKGEILNPIVFESPEYRNLIVNTGKNLSLTRLFGIGTPVALSAIGLGTDSTAAAVGQTQLNPSVAGTVYLQAFDATGTLGAQTVTVQTTFGTAVANFTINEAGIFNGTTNGTSTLFNRVVIGPFAKTSAVSIVYSTVITQS